MQASKIVWHIKKLLPSSREKNRVKRYLLPSKTMLHASRHQTTDWWQQAWKSQSEQQRFLLKQPFFALID
jgi:hypothetical protein